jgi:hypothetical protein
VASDIGPSELKQVTSCLLVAKHPVVVPLAVQFAPVLVLSPVPGFVIMGVARIPAFFQEHPGIKRVKGVAGNGIPVVVCPSPDDGVQSGNDLLDVATP